MGQSLHEVDLDAWRLTVAGEVDRPLALSYAQIKALPAINRRVLLICPDTFSFLADWKGVSLRRLLEIARARSGVSQVEIRSADDLIERVERFPVSDVRRDKVFLAYAVNGETLPEAHGFPLRVVAEDRYGNHWVKYVVSVSALAS
jgi:sulfoxide reductase catalytic subunit YedY